MSETQKNELDPTTLDVTELEDSQLEEAAGGVRELSDTTNNGCPTTNYGC